MRTQSLTGQRQRGSAPVLTHRSGCGLSATMSTKTPPAEESAGRTDASLPRYLFVGINRNGVHHIARLSDGTWFAIRDGTIAFRGDLESRAELVDYYDTVADGSGWRLARQREAIAAVAY